jgi:hypothetical protein
MNQQRAHQVARHGQGWLRSKKMLAIYCCHAPVARLKEVAWQEISAAWPCARSQAWPLLEVCMCTLAYLIPAGVPAGAGRNRVGVQGAHAYSDLVSVSHAHTIGRRIP